MKNNKMQSISIAGRKIGPGFPPFVIAEMSANHNGSIESALQIIAEAKRSGADAVKLQTYRPDTITLDCQDDAFVIKGGLWDGRTLYELYDKAHTPWEWHKTLFEYAGKQNITIFSSPFDNSAVDLLEDLGAPAYKIASFEAVDLPLIRYAASTGKPLIISTGMVNKDEIEEAVDTARSAGCTDLAILHCVSGYPAPATDYNLRTIPDMANHFDLVTGLSDHTLGNATAIASIALGASIVEKHFTLDNQAGGPDDSFSIEPDGLRALCEDTKIVWNALGQVNYGLKSSEQGNVVFQRSLYAAEDIKTGDTFTARNVKSIRPGYGLAPKHYDEIIGSTALSNITRGTPLDFCHYTNAK